MFAMYICMYMSGSTHLASYSVEVQFSTQAAPETCLSSE